MSNIHSQTSQSKDRRTKPMSQPYTQKYRIKLNGKTIVGNLTEQEAESFMHNLYDVVRGSITRKYHKKVTRNGDVFLMVPETMVLVQETTECNLYAGNVTREFCLNHRKYYHYYAEEPFMGDAIIHSYKIWVPLSSLAYIIFSKGFFGLKRK